MNVRRTGIWVLGTLVAAAGGMVAASTNPPAQATAVTVRTAPPAPAFALKDLDGREVKHTEFAGRPLLICFWATWDRPSLRQMPVLAEVHQKYADQGLRVVGISLDTDPPARLRERVGQIGVPFAVLMFDLPVVEGFGGITGIPTTFLVDRNYNIIQRYVGFIDRVGLELDLKAVLDAK